MDADATPSLNLADYFLDARLRDGHGARTAVRESGRTWTYDEIAARSCQWAHVLRTHGVRPEERVIIALPDGAEFVCVLFGILRLGAVVVMVNPDLQPDAMRYFVDYTRATAVVTVTANTVSFPDPHVEGSTTPRLLMLDTPSLQDQLAGAESSFTTFPSHQDDAAIWLFSGGTTGRPKAVVQVNRSFVCTTKRYGQGVLGLTAQDITLSVPKLFFGYALGSNVLFPFSVGACSVLFPERSTPERLFSLIARERPTVLINVPTMVQQMLAHAAHEHADLSSLRLATSAGEALPAELYTRWNDAFGVDLLDGLGTAEMWHIFISNRPGAVVPGTLGRTVDGFEVKLCDDAGVEVPHGEVGALWVKGGARALSYWQRLDESARAFRGEWYVSGDMLRQQPDDTFIYCGRADDMLKVSGKWLSPGELENCLLAHERVREVAVVGVSDAHGLVKPCAFVVADRPSDTLGTELQDFARERLDGYKYPRRVIFLESLPRTHLGKVDRHALGLSARVEADEHSSL